MIFWLYKRHIAARAITLTLMIKFNKLILVGGVPLLTIQLLAESGFASNATSYINLPHHHFAPLKLEELLVYYWMACKAAWRYFAFIWISIHRQGNEYSRFRKSQNVFETQKSVILYWPEIGTLT